MSAHRRFVDACFALSSLGLGYLVLAVFFPSVGGLAETVIQVECLGALPLAFLLEKRLAATPAFPRAVGGTHAPVAVPRRSAAA